MQLTIEKVKPTARSLVLTSGGKEYFAKKESGISAGMTIDAETETSDYNGKTYTWVKKWKPANGSAASQAAETARTASHAQGGPVNPAVAAPVWSNFVSNQVAHAIQAGLITEPSHIKLWAAAAKQAFVELA